MVEQYMSDSEARREQQYVDPRVEPSSELTPVWRHVAPSNSASERPSDRATVTPEWKHATYDPTTGGIAVTALSQTGIEPPRPQIPEQRQAREL